MARLDKDFLDLMPLTIQVRHRTGVNRYNEPSYGTAVSYRARMEPTSFRQGTGDAESRWVSARIIVDAQGTLYDTDLVTLPDGTTPDIISVTTEYDEHGIHHQVFMVEG